MSFHSHSDLFWFDHQRRHRETSRIDGLVGSVAETDGSAFARRISCGAGRCVTFAARAWCRVREALVDRPARVSADDIRAA